MPKIKSPLNKIQAQMGRNNSAKKTTFEGLITSHLTPVVQQISSVDSKIDSQSTLIWGMLGVVSATINVSGHICLVIVKRVLVRCDVLFKEAYLQSQSLKVYYLTTPELLRYPF